MPDKYSATQHYNQSQVLFNPLCRHHGKFLFLSMLKQWIEVEGHMFLNLKTLNIKTHRDSSFFSPLYKWTACLFYSRMKIFSHQSYSNALYHNRGNGILYSAKSTFMELIHSVFTKIHWIVVKTGLHFINTGTFQSEIVILVRDTHYMALISLQYVLSTATQNPFKIELLSISVMTHCQKFAEFNWTD